MIKSFSDILKALHKVPSREAKLFKHQLAYAMLVLLADCFLASFIYWMEWSQPQYYLALIIGVYGGLIMLNPAFAKFYLALETYQHFFAKTVTITKPDGTTETVERNSLETMAKVYGFALVYMCFFHYWFAILGAGGVKVKVGMTLMLFTIVFVGDIIFEKRQQWFREITYNLALITLIGHILLSVYAAIPNAAFLKHGFSKPTLPWELTEVQRMAGKIDEKSNAWQAKTDLDFYISYDQNTDFIHRLGNIQKIQDKLVAYNSSNHFTTDCLECHQPVSSGTAGQTIRLSPFEQMELSWYLSCLKAIDSGKPWELTEDEKKVAQFKDYPLIWQTMRQGIVDKTLYGSAVLTARHVVEKAKAAKRCIKRVAKEYDREAHEAYAAAKNSSFVQKVDAVVLGPTAFDKARERVKYRGNSGTE